MDWKSSLHTAFFFCYKHTVKDIKALGGFLCLANSLSRWSSDFKHVNMGRSTFKNVEQLL